MHLLTWSRPNHVANWLILLFYPTIPYRQQPVYCGFKLSFFLLCEVIQSEHQIKIIKR